MTRESFYKLFGEWPEDVLGEDWENYVQDYIDDNYDGLDLEE